MSGSFARAAPALGGLTRARSVSAHFALPGPLLDDFDGAGSLLAHFARTVPVGAFSQAGPVPGHPAQRVQGQLARVVRARPLPVYHLRPPKPGIA